jgi:hypothetical protein
MIDNGAPQLEDITAVVETPKDILKKYVSTSIIGGETRVALRLAGALPRGNAFPYDVGCFPSILGQIGDSPDLPIFRDAPSQPSWPAVRTLQSRVRVYASAGHYCL